MQPGWLKITGIVHLRYYTHFHMFNFSFGIDGISLVLEHNFRVAVLVFVNQRNSSRISNQIILLAFSCSIFYSVVTPNEFFFLSPLHCARKLIINDLQLENTKLNIENPTKPKRMKNSFTFGYNSWLYVL